jgi:hypothetical protein
VLRCCCAVCYRTVLLPAAVVLHGATVSHGAIVPTGEVVYLVLLSTWCFSETVAVILPEVCFLPVAIVLLLPNAFVVP